MHHNIEQDLEESRENLISPEDIAEYMPLNTWCEKYAIDGSKIKTGTILLTQDLIGDMIYDIMKPFYEKAEEIIKKETVALDNTLKVQVYTTPLIKNQIIFGSTVS